MQPGNMYEKYADISKSKELLRYVLKTNLEEGIKKIRSVS